jgi:hypothetical protein
MLFYPHWLHPNFSEAEMAKTGRSSYRTDDRLEFGLPNQRLKPPGTLSELEKRAFVALMAASPAGQFTAADMDLLVSWAETTVLARRAAKELELAGGPVQPDGRVSPWFGIHQQAIKTLNGLAIRLRLSPQGRAPTQRASKKVVAELSAYDLMALEQEGLSDDDDGTRRN